MLLRRFFGISFFLALSIVGCRKGEAFIDEAHRFEAVGQGAQFSLEAVPKEIHKLIVNFYAPDCPPCEKEIPALKKFYDKYRTQSSVGFIAVGSSLKAVEQNPKPGKDPPLTRVQILNELAAFNSKYSPPWPQYLADSADIKTWRITGFPETFLLERRNGRWVLQKKIISEISFETLEKFVLNQAQGESGGSGY